MLNIIEKWSEEEKKNKISLLSVFLFLFIWFHDEVKIGKQNREDEELFDLYRRGKTIKNFPG